MEVECNCVEEFDSELKNKTLEIMSSDKFINFVSEVGSLGGEDEFSWVRRTDEDYNYKTPENIKAEIEKFKSEQGMDFISSQKLVDYLSFSSKYWNPECLDELYNTVYVILAFENYGLTLEYLKKNSNKFSNICRCA